MDKYTRAHGLSRSRGPRAEYRITRGSIAEAAPLFINSRGAVAVNYAPRMVSALLCELPSPRKLADIGMAVPLYARPRSIRGSIHCNRLLSPGGGVAGVTEAAIGHACRAVMRISRLSAFNRIARRKMPLRQWNSPTGDLHDGCTVR